MRHRSEMAIWGGVMAGLEACRSSHTPLASLGEYLDGSATWVGIQRHADC